MTPDQIRRVTESLAETRRLLAKYETRKTFDRYQEAERVAQVEFCRAHIAKLEGMLAGGEISIMGYAA